MSIFSLPVVPGEERHRRLQGPLSAAPGDQRQGEDPFVPRDRRMPAPPVPARTRGQACARGGAPAVRRRQVSDGSTMAQAILLKDVDKLGESGDVIDVSPGYLRNYLVPRRLAQPATPAAIADSERRREAAERAVTEAAAKAEETAALLRKTVLTISHQAGDDGRLFGSVTSQEIVDAIRQARGVRLDKRRVQLEEPIRTTGTHMVSVEVSDGVTADIKTIVTPTA